MTDKKPRVGYFVMAVKWNYNYLEQYAKIPEGTDDERLLSAGHAEFKKWCEMYHDQSGQYADEFIRTRLWGWFLNLETAKRAVFENWGDNFDEAGYYDGAVIEAVPEGFMGFHMTRDDETGRPLRWFYRHVPHFEQLRKKARTEGYESVKEAYLEEMPEPRSFRSIVGITLAR